MGQGLQRLAVGGREVHQLHAEIGPGDLVAGVAAVDDDLVPALDEPAADLLDGGLEAAVVGGDPAGPQHGDSHGHTPARSMTRSSRHHLASTGTITRVLTTNMAV